MRMFRRRPEPELRQSTHDAVLSEVVVHFTITARTSAPLDIAAASRRLLRQDLAVTAAWPAEHQIRVSQRFKGVRRQLLWARKLQADADHLEARPGWLTSLRFALRHPRFARGVLLAAWARKAAPDLERLVSSSTLSALLWFLLKHPFFGIVRVLPHVRMSRAGASNSPTSDPTTVRHVDAGADADGPEPPEDDDRLAAARSLDEAERLILDQQTVSAAERVLDAGLFGGRDREENRFVRLVLRSSYHDIIAPGRAETREHVVLEPRVLLHEAGIIQLTIRTSAGGPLTADQAVGLAWSTEDVIVRSELPEGLLAGSPVPRDIVWAEQRDAEQRVAQIDHDEPVAIADLLALHLQAISSVIGVPIDGDGLTYPTSIITVGDCCGPERWQDNHRAEIRKIVSRYRGRGPLGPGADPGRDFSLHDDHSLYVTLGSATYLQWAGRPPHGLPELDTTLVLEYGQFLYARLLALENAVSRFQLNDRRLRRLYMDTIVLFSELRQGNLRSGTARDIAAHLLRELGGDGIRSTIDTALQLAGSAHATVSAAQAARRSLRLTVIGTTIALLVAVPPVTELLAALNDSPPGDGWGDSLTPFRLLARWGTWGAWALLAAIVAMFLVAAVVRRLLSLRHVRLRSGRKGPAWPTLIHVTSVSDDADDRDAEENPSPPSA